MPFRVEMFARMKFHWSGGRAQLRTVEGTLVANLARALSSRHKVPRLSCRRLRALAPHTGRYRLVEARAALTFPSSVFVFRVQSDQSENAAAQVRAPVLTHLGRVSPRAPVRRRQLQMRVFSQSCPARARATLVHPLRENELCEN